jgi:hypothetical protein
MEVEVTLDPNWRPGKDLLERTTPEMSPSVVILRDLERYYALLEVAARRIRGRFSPRELDALALALRDMIKVDAPEFFYVALEAVEESNQYEELCAKAGIDNCQSFLDQVRKLELAEIWVLMDAIGRYLALPKEERGEEAWKKLGLL